MQRVTRTARMVALSPPHGESPSAPVPPAPTTGERNSMPLPRLSSPRRDPGRQETVRFLPVLRAGGHVPRICLAPTKSAAWQASPPSSRPESVRSSLPVRREILSLLLPTVDGRAVVWGAGKACSCWGVSQGPRLVWWPSARDCCMCFTGCHLRVGTSRRTGDGGKGTSRLCRELPKPVSCRCDNLWNIFVEYNALTACCSYETVCKNTHVSVHVSNTYIL